MKVLKHDGFLHGPGLLQLETVQKFFEIINDSDEPPKFQFHKEKVVDFCQNGKRVYFLPKLYNKGAGEKLGESRCR